MEEEGGGGGKHNVFLKLDTASAEFFAELILERAGPVILKTVVLEFLAFRQIPAICLAGRAFRENCWKR